MNKTNYYSKRLFATKLKLAYEIASPRIQKYLEEEIKFVINQINTDDKVLEIGCGYGRVLAHLAKKSKYVVGIDTAKNSLELAKHYLKEFNNIEVYHQTARNILFDPSTFDAAIAIQNPISSFKIDPKILVKQAIRVTRNKGKVLLSSYSEKIWKDRLEWFEDQSKKGLLGEIDYEKTGNGTITCKDGFKATTFTINDFKELIKELKLEAEIKEVDESSIFCIITVNQ